MLEERAKDNPYSAWSSEYRQLLTDRAMWNLENDRLVSTWDSIKMLRHVESNPDMLEECAKDNPHSFFSVEYRQLLEDRATWKIEDDWLTARWKYVKKSCCKLETLEEKSDIIKRF